MLNKPAFEAAFKTAQALGAGDAVGQVVVHGGPHDVGELGGLGHFTVHADELVGVTCVVLVYHAMRFIGC